MTKGIIGENVYEITEAGGVNYKCAICGKAVEKTPDEAKKFLRNGDLPQTFDFLCLKCWKQRADDEDAWEFERTKNQRAGIGQAINMAHNHILTIQSGTSDGALRQAMQEELFDLSAFYYELAQKIQKKLGN